MQLKILVVPFFLVMILILSIGYMKPDFDEIRERSVAVSLPICFPFNALAFSFSVVE